MNIELWGYFEEGFQGNSKGNPFREVLLTVEFEHEAGTVVKTTGFYDGNGIYKIRFMPEQTGHWNYRTYSNAPELDAKTGELDCIPATGNNHGPMRVREQFHFAYADGTPFYPFTTTAYAWIHQSEELQKQTLETLKDGPFNKMRMCVFPKSYDFNHNEPELYPFEGSLADGFDFTRPNPQFFAHLEQRIRELSDLNIECDLILFHPYDRWNFSSMGAENDEFYLKYVGARLSSMRNIWWSMANEYDLFMTKNTYKNTTEDWERLAKVISDNDPYHHLNSIHNCMKFYDYKKPWITHCSIQRIDYIKTSENTEYWRNLFGKPIVIDECAYEGNINHGWGNITGQEMTRRFWEGVIRGGYMGHGETYMHPEDILWWSHGGVLHGSSPERIAFLRKIVESLPHPINPVSAGLKDGEMMVNFDVALGLVGEDCQLIYTGFNQPSFRTFSLSRKKKYEVEIIDTWEMTIVKLEGTFTGDFKVDLPGKPYICIKITCVGTADPVFSSEDNRFSFESTMGEMLDHEKAYALLEQYLPEIINNPMLSMAKGMKFSQMLQYSPDMLEPEKLKAFETDLKKIGL